MDHVAEIQQKITEGQFEFSRHATDRMILRQITIQKIREAMALPQSLKIIPMINMVPVVCSLG